MDIRIIMTYLEIKLEQPVVLITFIKPNLIIHSDQLMNGRIQLLDKKHRSLWKGKVEGESFISIEVQPEWPEKIEVEIDTDHYKIRKEISLQNTISEKTIKDSKYSE